MHSGSVACMDSSMRMEEKRILESLASPAPMQVHEMTSATSRSSRSACFLSERKRFSSFEESSPVSSLSCCSLRSSPELGKEKK